MNEINKRAVIVLALLGATSATISSAQVLDFKRMWTLGLEARPTSRGYLVEGVTPGGPADRANIQRDDYIQTVNGVRVGYLPEHKFYPLVYALNATDGNVELGIGFASASRQWREFVVKVELLKRGERMEGLVQGPTISTSPASDAQVAELPSGAVDLDATSEADDVNEPPLPSDGDGAINVVSRDERGVVVEQLNPVNPDAPRPAEDGDRE